MSTTFCNRRSDGLTVIEVLIAMVVILVGMLGIAAMIPYAIRQADESYKITQGLAAGENALGVFRSHAIVRPRLDVPWQVINDEFVAGRTSDSRGFEATSWSDVYNIEYRRLLAINPPANLDAVAILQNQIIGNGFCIDPLFWGYQERIKIGLNDRGVFRRTRFPFFREDAIAGALVPRLRRVSITDPQGSDANGNSGWLRLAASIPLATMHGGDLIVAKPDVDNSFPPLRGEYVDANGALIQPLSAPTNVSWMATVVPSDATPIIRTASLSTQVSPPPIEIFPESYDVSVVVFTKRDVREALDPTTGIVPVSERLGNVVFPDLEHRSSSSFDMEIQSTNPDAIIKVGDWLMLSRYSFLNPFVFQAGTNVRERHKWYRVISVGSEESFPKTVRVTGQPWDFTLHELAAARLANPNINPTLLPNALTMPNTQVTLVRGAIHVYQRNVDLQSL
jgi:Tfp pilus assembly protein PilV